MSDEGRVPGDALCFFFVASTPFPRLVDRLSRNFSLSFSPQGMGVSNEGFVAILTSNESPRALKLLITPDDPMSGGLDVEQAETSEARTLLQLMQASEHVGRNDTVAPSTSHYAHTPPPRPRSKRQQLIITPIHSFHAARPSHPHRPRSFTFFLLFFYF